MIEFRKPILIVLLIIIFVSCSKQIYRIVYPPLSDGRYDTEFPYKNASKELEDITRSVQLLNYVGFFKTYIFNLDQKLTQDVINHTPLEDTAVEEIFYNEARAATATIIFYNGQKIALLSVAHIGDFPDTLVTHFDGVNQDYIQSISIKLREHYFLPELRDENELKLLKKDTKLDIAVFGKQYEALDNEIIPVFDYPIGDSKRLEWGSFVYVIGHPVGHKMITRGIVSKPYGDRSDSFLIDALFNYGFSGGLVLAIKDGVPNFELVGIAKSVSAKTEYVLIPDQTSHDLIPVRYPYKGDTYIDIRRNINYGVTYSIPIKSIRRFFKKNNKYFNSLGYNFSLMIDG